MKPLPLSAESLQDNHDAVSALYAKLHRRLLRSHNDPGHMFAHSTREHVDPLDVALPEIRRCVKLGSGLLQRVVADHFVYWSSLSRLSI